MIEYSMQSECVGCPQGCINCGRKEKTPYLENFVCDVCGDDSERLYERDGQQICASCILQELQEINEYNFEEFIYE